MVTIQAGILSLLIALSGALRDGLQAFKDGKNDEAIASFTKVVEEKSPVADKFRATALFYRAQARHAKKDDKNALSDLVAVLKLDGVSKTISEKARALYVDCGGDPKELFPTISPTETFKKFVDAINKKDKEGALALCAEGEWKTMAAGSIDREPIPDFHYGREVIGQGELAGTATLRIGVTKQEFGPRSVIFKFVLDKKNNKWLIKGIDKQAMMLEMARQNNQMKQRGRLHPEISSDTSNEGKLKSLFFACANHAGKHAGRFPDDLRTLKSDGLLDNEVFFWIDPDNSGVKARFLYCPGFSKSDDDGNILAAAPKPYKNTRLALYLDGHVEAIPEKDFIAKAKEQKWGVPGVVKKSEVPEDKLKAVRALVKQLGDDDFKTRENAKKKLKEMGLDAFPVLEEYKNVKDPEVRSSVRDILNRR